MNGDGTIDIEEFKSILPTNYRKTILQGLNNNNTQMSTLGVSHQDSLDTEDPNPNDDSFDLFQKQQIKDNIKWKSILSEVDTNGDGVISFDEFNDAL